MGEHHISIDIETFSSVDIKKSGLYKYAQSPDFSILLFAYSIDGGGVEIVDMTKERLPENIKRILFSPNYLKHAYNAAFEWYCLSRYFSLKDEQSNMWLAQWRDTMLHGLYCGFPPGLDAAGKAVGLTQDKQKMAAGKALIKIFCSPCKPSKTNGASFRIFPEQEREKWELFKTYCRQDVITEMAIENKLAAFPVPEWVQKQWELDLIQNKRGVAIDTELIEGAIYCHKSVSAEKEMKAITGLENPNSMTQLKKWLSEETGQTITSLSKETVSSMLIEELPENVRQVLRLRQENGKTSIKKYTAMLNAVCSDGRLRGMLQFYGANRTGRWAGRLVQVQNLPRTELHGAELNLARKLIRQRNINALKLTFGSVSDTLAQVVRTAFIPADGKIFIDADFSAIEARVIAWLAGEEWVLNVFRTHGKIYEAAASQMFGVPMDKIVKGQPEYALRQKGKVATLALGYQGGSGALINMGALKMGLSEEELPDIVSRWRLANPNITRCWKSIENAALQAIETGRSVGARGLVFTREADITKGIDALTVLLPSGRKLFYINPHMGTNRWGGKTIQYYGINQKTKKWEAVDTYGGKLTENIVQAIARDCLAYNIQRLEENGFKIVFHIHDEVIIESENDELSRVLDIMGSKIPFAPGLPMKADGWSGTYFTKD